VKISIIALALAGVVAFSGTAAWADGAGSSSADIATRGLTKADFPRWKMIAPDVYEYEGTHPGIVIPTVSLIVVTPDGVLVADGQADPAQGQAMVDTIKKITRQPVKYMVVASEHGDHTGGNAAFKAAWPDMVFLSSPASQKALAKDANPPTETVAGKRVIRMGGTEIDVMDIGRSHTGGDLVVYLPKTKVLFMSETYLRGMFPAMRSGFPSEWVAAIEKAQAMDVSWYIPGHGFVDDQASMKRDLEQFRKELVAVIAEAKRLHDAHLPCPSAKDCPAAKEADWGPYADWFAADSQGPIAIADVYRELDGTLPKKE
jgi:glyoxylase-like metal-dependent hydrolase (beta-lactamase superfamily II)